MRDKKVGAPTQSCSDSRYSPTYTHMRGTLKLQGEHFSLSLWFTGSIKVCKYFWHTLSVEQVTFDFEKKGEGEKTPLRLSIRIQLAPYHRGYSPSFLLKKDRYSGTRPRGEPRFFQAPFLHREKSPLNLATTAL